MSGDGAQQTVRTPAQLRADIALTRDFAYFQTGSQGPVPDSTQRVICGALKEANGAALGGVQRFAALVQRAEKARHCLADFLNVSTDTLTWADNTSSAIRMAVLSLPWQAGDRLAISGTEHTSTRTLVRGLAKTVGCETTVIPVGKGPSYSAEAFLCQLERTLTPDHRLLILSHVSCIDGRRLPVVQATRIAHRRGVKVLVDGAQSVGQVPVDVAEIDPEFFAGSIHKWLLGPAGLGYLVVARRQLPEFNPGLPPYVHPIAPESDERPLTASRQTEVGTQSMSLRLATGHAVDIVTLIGLEQIERHARELTAQLRDGLRQISAPSRAHRHLPARQAPVVLTPDSWELSSGITSLDFPDCSAEQVRSLIERMWLKFRVVVKFQNEFAGIRISVASFNSQEEVNQLLSALDELAPQM
jgi:selenocysteine lyase/cysteine desulfurase